MDIIKDTLHTSLEFLDKLILDTKEAAELLQSNEEGAAYKIFPELFEGFSMMLKVFYEFKRLNYNLELDQDNFHEQLPELEQALLKKDFVLVSDILEYELLPVLTHWKNIIEEEIQRN